MHEHVNADHQDQQTDDASKDVLGNASQEASADERAGRHAGQADDDLWPVLQDRGPLRDEIDRHSPGVYQQGDRSRCRYEGVSLHVKAERMLP